MSTSPQPGATAAAARRRGDGPDRARDVRAVVRTLVFGVPPAALVLAGWLAWGGALHWHDLVVLAITYTLTGLGITVGYPPAVHPPQLQDHAPGAGAAGRARLDGGRGARDRVGRHPPQAPPLLRPPGDPHSPHVDHAPGVARRAARARPRARRLDVPRQGHGQPRPLRQGPARRPRPALHQPHLPALGGRRAGAPVRPRRGADRLARRAASPACCGAAPCACSSCTTRPSASTRCATSSAGGRSPPAISRATSPGSRRSPSARRGTTTTTPSRPPPATAWAAGSSIPAPG